jgi:hypothetical protein
MRFSRLASVMFVVGVSGAATIIACGSSGGNGTPDAKTFKDAAGSGSGSGSGSAGLTGLGQKCAFGSASSGCPASASDCVAIKVGSGASNGWCTPHCDDAASGMTNGSGALSPSSLNPAADQTKCTAAYSGSGGVAACGLLLAYTPMDNPLVANKAYTGISLGCVVACGSGGVCPSSMSCVGNALCTPN